jgi:hypothetical protein
VRGGPIGQRLLRLERRYEAQERGLSRPERRSRVPQPDLVLLLDWMRETANVYTAGTNTNARAANGDTATHSLSPATNGDTHAATLSSTANGDADGSSDCDDDSHLDAHHSGNRHGHSPTLVDQLADNIPERSASPGFTSACPEAGDVVCSGTTIRDPARLAASVMCIRADIVFASLGLLVYTKSSLN